MSEGNTRKRITPAEVIVVVAILVVAAVLVLPMVHNAREASRRTLCKDNLKRIGLAMHGYHEAHRVFPPGITSTNFLGTTRSCEYVAPPTGTCEPESAGLSQSSAFMMILPFMEEKKVYESYNQSLACCSLANSTSTRSIIQAYLCPSNFRDKPLIESSYYRGYAAPTDYLLNKGANAFLTCWHVNKLFQGPAEMFPYPPTMRNGIGPFEVNSFTHLRDFRDATSRTFLVGEGAGGSGISVGLPIYASSATEMIAPIATQPRASVDQAWSQGYIGNNGVGGYGSIFGASAFDVWHDSPYVRLTDPMNGGNATTGWTPLRLNMNKLEGVRATSAQFSIRTGVQGWSFPGKVSSFAVSFTMSPFRSQHSDIAHFLFADGSVHVIQENIDDKIYAGFSTLSGKEPLEGIRE